MRFFAAPVGVSVALVGVMATPVDAQNIVGNGSFETPPAGGAFVNRSGAGAMGPWDVGGNIDHIGGLWAAAAGTQSLDLNGSGPGSVSQSLATTPGQRYRIRYAVSENFFGVGDKTMDIAWGGAVIAAVTVVHDPARTVTDMRWSNRQLIVTATAATTVLSFQSTTGAMNGSQGFQPFYGPALDDVSVVAVACCPADFNCDNQVSSQDFFDFVGAFFANSSDADFNTDLVVNSQDFFDFLAAFFVGC